MGKSREQYIAELEAIDQDKEFVVKDDHNVNDIKAFIELIQCRKEKAEYQKQKAKLHDEVEELTELNAELAEALADMKGQASSAKVVKVGRDKVEIMHSVKLKGVSYSTEAIAEDEAVIKELLKRGSSAVRIVED